MKSVFDELSIASSRMITRMYSTSFSMGTRMLGRKYRDPVYSIYGFVRLADEIVDTFHAYDRKELFEEFKRDTERALQDGINLNPVLNSFQKVVKEYNIERELINAFFRSMEMDLHQKDFNREEFNEYVLGSAEVVGLMCLRIFCDGEEDIYRALKPAAMRLGAAFQKINFLRDLKQDFKDMGRSYFPGISPGNFTERDKHFIEEEIEEDFRAGLEGIRQLPDGVFPGVFMSYAYYYALFRKIRNLPARRLLEERIRISNFRKYMILLRYTVLIKLGILRKNKINI